MIYRYLTVLDIDDAEESIPFYILDEHHDDYIVFFKHPSDGSYTAGHIQKGIIGRSITVHDCDSFSDDVLIDVYASTTPLGSDRRTLDKLSIFTDEVKFQAKLQHL